MICPRPKLESDKHRFPFCGIRPTMGSELASTEHHGRLKTVGFFGHLCLLCGVLVLRT